MYALKNITGRHPASVYVLTKNIVNVLAKNMLEAAANADKKGQIKAVEGSYTQKTPQEGDPHQVLLFHA